MSEKARAALNVLMEDLKRFGPVQHQWPNYGKLKGHGRSHHCHLNRGRPTYVVCWEDQPNNHLEVYYAGTHENAPY